MRSIITSIFTLLTLITFGQNLNDQIKSIQTLNQANDYIKANPVPKSEIIEINSEKDNSGISKKIMQTNPDKIVIADGYVYKIVDVKKEPLLRASYIYLNGKTLSIEQIDSIRKIILLKYNSGTTFPALATEYNMDGNTKCDLGWFKYSWMVSEFSSAVKNHKKGGIFTIDIPERKWYYVTLKTDKDREIKTYSVLKTKEIKTLPTLH